MVCAFGKKTRFMIAARRCEKKSKKTLQSKSEEIFEVLAMKKKKPKYIVLDRNAKRSFAKLMFYLKISAFRIGCDSSSSNQFILINA